MIRLFLFIKEKLPALWRRIEWLNGVVFSILYSGRFRRSQQIAFRNYTLEGCRFREVEISDLPLLSEMILKQGKEELHYFEAHAFDVDSLKKMLRNPSFLMMIVTAGDKPVGYFFLRCLINRECFVGRIVDHDYRGKGIGKVMNEILYNTTWDSGFRCFATVSKKNKLVMAAHKANDRVVFLEDLPDNHILIEFKKQTMEL